ncbi:energy transducer TonB [Flavobacterium sp. J27]|uniref:energy transducer TonB n=1 Tax=Flavobacterium sp. J27 TaxID=2060419 RepID=UPI0010309319|nr:energy transducer TonB [Flavobacterium sp. J27]
MLKNTIQTKWVVSMLLFFISFSLTSFKNRVEMFIIEDFVDFAVAEEIPQFKGCDGFMTRKEAVECFNKKMMNHIKRNFTYPEEAVDRKIEGRVDVSFIITNAGLIKDITAKASNDRESDGELLEYEAKRIISMLPKFTPGKHQGKLVNVKYGLPITFRMM